jgi:hypothetical protein
MNNYYLAALHTCVGVWGMAVSAHPLTRGCYQSAS